jgi:hypothetical protein
MAVKRWYKPERHRARKKGVVGKIAPIGCPDASQAEVVSALAAICDASCVRVGRGGEYDQLKDEYTVIAKVLDGGRLDGIWTGKVQDVKIKGDVVADAIRWARHAWGGRYDRPMTWASQ